MSELIRGQEVEAVGDIQLGSGFIFPKGTKGVVIGMSTDKETVSVQFEDYVGAVSVWTSLVTPATELAPAQPATADAGAEDTLAGVDKVGILEKYLREGRLIDAIKAHRRFYGSDIHEAKEACDQLKYDMKLREQNQPTYADLQAKLAAAEARADAAINVLRDIARNAPQEQPPANEMWKWTFWFAGSVAKSCVDALATSEAANG